MDQEDRQLGPVDYAVFEFPGNRFNGEIAPNILDLVERGVITVLDLVFVKKDQDGNVTGVEIENMSDSEIGSLSLFAGQVDELLSEEDIREAGSVLEPDSSALLAVWENTWAAPLATALHDSGGQLVSSGRIPAQDLLAAVEAAE